MIVLMKKGTSRLVKLAMKQRAAPSSGKVSPESEKAFLRWRSPRASLSFLSRLGSPVPMAIRFSISSIRLLSSGFGRSFSFLCLLWKERGMVMLSEIENFWIKLSLPDFVPVSYTHLRAHET